MDTLTVRAERALLGAMIADPALVGRLRLSSSEFASESHAALYESIRAAAQTQPGGMEGWRAAILQAAPSLTSADLNVLAAACPFAAHGPAYAVMVVQAWARRHLDQSAHTLGARSTQLDADAQQVMAFDRPAGLELASGANHMREVAFAIHEHARELSPQAPGPSSGRRRGANPERVRREEAVLAGLLQQDPQRNLEILRMLSWEAFTNPHRREIYHVLTAMTLTGRPVDELTLDWELASRGIPIDARQSSSATRDETYAMYLARLDHDYQEPLTAAHELAAEYWQAPTENPAGSARLRAVGGRQAGRPRGDPSAGRVPGRPALRLVQPPPEAGPSERGPQAR